MRTQSPRAASWQGCCCYCCSCCCCCCCCQLARWETNIFRNGTFLSFDLIVVLGNQAKIQERPLAKSLSYSCYIMTTHKEMHNPPLSSTLPIRFEGFDEVFPHAAILTICITSSLPKFQILSNQKMEIALNSHVIFHLH